MGGLNLADQLAAKLGEGDGDGPSPIEQDALEIVGFADDMSGVVDSAKLEEMISWGSEVKVGNLSDGTYDKLINALKTMKQVQTAQDSGAESTGGVEHKAKAKKSHKAKTNKARTQKAKKTHKAKQAALTPIEKDVMGIVDYANNISGVADSAKLDDQISWGDELLVTATLSSEVRTKLEGAVKDMKQIRTAQNSGID